MHDRSDACAYSQPSVEIASVRAAQDALRAATWNSCGCTSSVQLCVVMALQPAVFSIAAAMPTQTRQRRGKRGGEAMHTMAEIECSHASRVLVSVWCPVHAVACKALGVRSAE